MNTSAMEVNSNPEGSRENGHPSPLDLDIYLPWACGQLQVDATIVVNKVIQQEYVSISALSDKGKNKQKTKSKTPSQNDLDSDHDKDDKSDVSVASEGNLVTIYAVYDGNDNLVQLNFNRNRKIPRIIFKILGIIIQYHMNLSSMTINKGLDQLGLYEICKFLPLSNITHLCLDNSFIKEANFHILLEQQNFLRNLSLARCSVTDDVVKTLTDNLAYPSNSSRTLSILNLSSNRITDTGCKYIAEALRSNRQLSYLNLADNMITDIGAGEILDILMNFPVSYNELLASRSRHIEYLRDKNELALQIARDLRDGDLDRRSIKRKSAKPVPTVSKKPKGVEKEPSIKSMPESKSMTTLDNTLMERATVMAENTLGEFKDPFSKRNIFIKNDIVYNYGNNTLCYLNMAYNNLNYMSVNKLLSVLDYQRKVDRKPRGLVNLSVEGNSLPICCKELEAIDRILDMNMSLQSRRMSMHKKRPPSKASTK